MARELFATTLDVALLLKHMPDEPDNLDTADGRPATKADARRRMSRMVCANDDEFKITGSGSVATSRRPFAIAVGATYHATVIRVAAAYALLSVAVAVSPAHGQRK